MNNVYFEGISENMSYLFTNKGVTKISLELNDLNGKNYVPYTYENLNVAIDILKENIDFRYKTGVINLQEYTSHPRKFLNTLIEIFKPKNQISSSSKIVTSNVVPSGEIDMEPSREYSGVSKIE